MFEQKNRENMFPHQTFNPFFTTKRIEEIESTMRSENFSWFFQPKTVVGDDAPEHDCWWLSHKFINEGEDSSEFASLARSIISDFSEKTGIEFSKIIRAQAGLTYNDGTKNITPSHLDDDRKHVVLIYYVNNSDGDTLLYHGESGEVLTNVTPQAGKFALFDGATWHSGTLPIVNNDRMIINFNLEY